jgi:hypothetical protein
MPLPEMTGAYGAFGGETIYLLVMPLTGFIAAKVVQFGVGVLMLVSAYQQVLGARRDEDLPVWLFAFWGSSLVWWQMFAGFVDLFQAFYYYACILAMRTWLDERRPVWLSVAGVSGAAATMVKLNGATALVVAGLIVVGITFYQARSARQVWMNGLWLALPALLILMPWLIRSHVLTGNPVFPFVNRLFQSSLAPLDHYSIHYGPGLELPGILQIPWGIFFQPKQFSELGTYHPFLLAMAPLALIGLTGARHKDTLWLSAGALAGLGWLVTEQNSRYLLYAAFLLSLASSFGLSSLTDMISGDIRRRLYTGLCLVVLVLGFGIQALRPTFGMNGHRSGPFFPTQVVFGAQSEAAYLSANTLTFTCAEFLNQHYEDQTKVWQVPPLRDHLYFRSQAFALPHGILPATQPLFDILDPRGGRDLAGDYQRLVEMGFTHLMYDTRVPRLVNVPETERQGIFSPAFEQTFLQLECADRGVRLYRIRTVPALTENTPIGVNLVQNAGFEALGLDGRPVHWDIRGAPRVSQEIGNTRIHLQVADQLTQPVVVSEGRIYELSVDIKTDRLDQVGYVQINWLGSAGRLVLFWREAVSHSGAPARYRFLQTAPAGAHQAVIYLIGGEAGMGNVSFREVVPEGLAASTEIEPVRGGQIVYDFLANFSSATITPNTPFSTPTGKGALILAVDPKNQGQSRDSLIVLPGVEVDYALTVPPTLAYLVFNLALRAPSDGATVEVWVTAQGQPVQVFLELVQPERPWRPVSVDLSRWAEQPIIVSFRTGPGPSGDATADWLALSNVQLISSQSAAQTGAVNSSRSATTALGLLVHQILPARTHIGQGFNIQPNGQSALAVDCEGATPSTAIMFGDTVLNTAYGGPTLVTAIVPAELWARPGHYEVYLKNESGESNRLGFVVEP